MLSFPKNSKIKQDIKSSFTHNKLPKKSNHKYVSPFMEDLGQIHLFCLGSIEHVFQVVLVQGISQEIKDGFPDASNLFDLALSLEAQIKELLDLTHRVFEDVHQLVVPIFP